MSLTIFLALFFLQEKSFQRGVSYVVANVAELNVHQWLALHPWRNNSPKVQHFRWPFWFEISWCPLSCASSSLLDCLTFYFWTIIRPFYRKGKPSNFRVLSQNKCLCQSEAPAMLVLDSAPARSVREAIQEVKMVHACFLLSWIMSLIHGIPSLSASCTHFPWYCFWISIFLRPWYAGGREWWHGFSWVSLAF